MHSLAAVIALALLGASTHAMADPTASDKETARRLMAEGRTHRKAGDPKGALQAFQAADAIMHVPTTGLEVARAELELGQLVEARDMALTVVRLPVEAREPHAFAEARNAAKALANETEGRIPSIKIQLQNAPVASAGGPGGDSEVKVSVDGVTVPTASLIAPRAVNPGHHVVQATTGAAGDKPHETAIDVREGETKDVVVDLASVPPSDDSAAAEKPVAPPTQHAPMNTWRLVTYGGFGVGGASLILGSITGLIAISDLSSAKHGCSGNQCPPSAYPELNSSSTMATVSTVSFVLAGLGAGVGVAGLFLGRAPHAEKPEAPASDPDAPASPSPETPPEAPAVMLYFGPGSAGLHGTF